MLYIKKLLLIIILIFPSYLQAYEIHMKSGKIIEVESFWEKNGEIVYEQFGTTIYIDKNKIQKIINLSEEENLKAKEVRINEQKELEKKYNTSGAIVFLKDGSTIITKKTWFQDGLIYCETDKKTLHLTTDQIAQIGKASKITKNDNKSRINEDLAKTFEKAETKSVLMVNLEEKMAVVVEDYAKFFSGRTNKLDFLKVSGEQSEKLSNGSKRFLGFVISKVTFRDSTKGVTSSFYAHTCDYEIQNFGPYACVALTIVALNSDMKLLHNDGQEMIWYTKTHCIPKGEKKTFSITKSIRRSTSDRINRWEIDEVSINLEEVETQDYRIQKNRKY